MRIRSVHFIPTSINFSAMAPNQENTFYDESEEEKRDKEIDKELLLLKMLRELDSDKERAVLLLEILREYGYAIDYNSCAKALNVQLRWFMRVKRAVHQKVRKITTNES